MERGKGYCRGVLYSLNQRGKVSPITFFLLSFAIFSYISPIFIKLPHSFFFSFPSFFKG